MINPEPYVALGAICEEAKKIIGGARHEEYGTPAESFNRIATYWNLHIKHTKNIDINFTGKDIAMLMVLFKIARQENKHKHDNLTDIIGYTALLDYMYELDETKVKNMVRAYNGIVDDTKTED